MDLPPYSKAFFHIFPKNFKPLHDQKFLHYGMIKEEGTKEVEMSITLLDGTLQVNVFYEKGDHEFEDNVCISFKEDCPEDEKIFYAGETNIFITSAQARELAALLIKAADQSNHGSR
jgi:hypothetical protein